MKKYSEYRFASISMADDSNFILALENLFLQNDIMHILETGTFLGLGSSTWLAKAILNSKKELPQFITLEVDSKSYKKALKNLSQYTFITPLWGLSVSSSEAKNFIQNDEAILNHHNYPHIFIDDIDEPIKFYLTEIEGKLSILSNSETLCEKIKNKIIFSRRYDFQDNLFEKIIPTIQKNNPLFLLDSAGGLGYLEFQKVQLLMEGYSHYLILDDIHHLKHFRSYEEICRCEDYSIIAKNLEQGWVIAKFSK